MSIPDNFLTYVLTCLGIGVGISVTLLFAAITGNLDVFVGTWRVFSVPIKSTPLRVFFFVLPVGFFALLIWMIRHFESFIKMMK